MICPPTNRVFQGNLDGSLGGASMRPPQLGPSPGKGQPQRYPRFVGFVVLGIGGGGGDYSGLRPGAEVSNVVDAEFVQRPDPKASKIEWCQGGIRHAHSHSSMCFASVRVHHNSLCMTPGHEFDRKRLRRRIPGPPSPQIWGTCGHRCLRRFPGPGSGFRQRGYVCTGGFAHVPGSTSTFSLLQFLCVLLLLLLPLNSGVRNRVYAFDCHVSAASISVCHPHICWTGPGTPPRLFA